MQLLEAEKALREAQAAVKSRDRELERCKAEGDGMRDEVSAKDMGKDRAGALSAARRGGHL